MAALKTTASRIPYALISSYVLDWIGVIVLVVVGFVIETLPPNHRAFSLTDPDISFPLHDDTVSTAVLIIVSLVAPAVIIFLLIPFVVPGSTSPNQGFKGKGRIPASLLWGRRAWELHASWLGLVVSLSSCWFVMNGLKQLAGKPRPNMLARCQPDLTGPIAQYVVGGFVNEWSDGRLVSVDICTNPDKSVVDEGFRSFPSGHSSFSAAGLVYLSLFLVAKLRAAIPAYAYQNDRYLAEPCDVDEAGGADSHFAAFPTRLDTHIAASASQQNGAAAGRTLDSPNTATNADLEEGLSGSNGHGTSYRRTLTPVRQQGAAPPFWLIIISAIPFFACVYICVSRWYDYMHHGFDILFGFFIGSVFAVVSFWYYHPSVSRGGGWAWGPRSKGRAFWAGLGLNSWSRDGESSAGRQREMMMTGERGVHGQRKEGLMMGGPQHPLEDMPSRG